MLVDTSKKGYGAVAYLYSDGYSSLAMLKACVVLLEADCTEAGTYLSSGWHQTTQIYSSVDFLSSLWTETPTHM